MDIIKTMSDNLYMFDEDNDLIYTVEQAKENDKFKIDDNNLYIVLEPEVTKKSKYIIISNEMNDFYAKCIVNEQGILQIV